MERYEKYKDSGIEWIGVIPEHWETNKFNRIAFFQEGPGLRNWQFTTSGIKVICVTNIVPPIIDFSSFQKYISEQEYNDSYQHFTVNKGDLLLASSGASWGKVSVYEDDETVILNTSTIRLNENHTQKVARNFIKWIIQSPYVFEQLNVLLTGSCQPNFGPSHLSQLRCAYPKEKIEQLKVSSYLDRKTAEIDRIIATKQKLIALYEEEKQAIINQAVTKGLDANVTLKDSGVSFFGMIPEHWKVKKIKYLLKKNRGALKTGPFGSQLKNSDLTINGQFKVYTQRNVLDNDYKSGEDRINENKFEDLKEFKIEPFDILFTSRGTIGKCSVFLEGCEIGILHPCLIRIQIDTEKVISKWIINYVNGSTHFIDNVKYESNSTIIDVIYGGTLKEIFIPLPSITEQIEINEFIQNESKRLDVIIEKFNKQIDLLKEYRTTLISEVVTGKIMVTENENK